MNPIGVMLNSLGPDRLQAYATAARLGFPVVHANALPEAWLQGPQRDAYVAAARSSGVAIDTLFVGFDGQDYTDRRTIAATVGLVRPEFRTHRFAVARQYLPLARELNAASLSLHLGFLPDDPNHPDYVATATELRKFLDDCAAARLSVRLETGQESGASMLRLIQVVDHPYLRVNFDPANFLLYGTDVPGQALGILRPFVHGVHCKDAVPRTPDQPPEALGREVPLGQGLVDLPGLLNDVIVNGFRGPFVIERESGTDRIADVLAARAYLEGLLRARG